MNSIDPHIHPTRLKCYDYLGCTSKDCKMFGNKDPILCWKVLDTLCNFHGLELLEETGKWKCEICIYYKASKC